MKKAEMNCLSFFSGAMGLDQGLARAGFRVRVACESDATCRRTIRANHPDLPILDDIFQTDAEGVLRAAGVEAGDVVLIAGGPPCQSFSTAGKRKGMDCRNGTAMAKYLEIVAAISPPYVLLENVRGLLSSAGGGDLQFVLDQLEAAGYTVSFDLYNTANFGVPQARERLILIGSRRGRVPYVPQTHAQSGAGGLLPWRTFRDACGAMEEHEHGSFSDERARVLRLVPAGGCWRDLPNDVARRALGGGYESGGGKVGYFRRIAWDRPAPTMVTSPMQKSTMLCHPEETRPLSIQEYLALQTFPSEWHLEGSLSARYKQVGNAVPVVFAEAVGRTIAAHFRGEAVSIATGTKNSRYHNTSDLTWKKRKTQK